MFLDFAPRSTINFIHPISIRCSAVRRRMKEYQIVPDVISVAPRRIARVTYCSGAWANLGKELTPTQVKDMPTVKWSVDPSALYTLVFIDPDAPSRQEPTQREVCTNFAARVFYRFSQ